MRIRHRVLQAGGWAFAGFAVEKGIAVLQLVVLARLLVPGDFGLMMASAAILLAVQAFSELGLEPAVIAKPDVNEEDLRVAWTLSIIRGTRTGHRSLGSGRCDCDRDADSRTRSISSCPYCGNSSAVCTESGVVCIAEEAGSKKTGIV